MTTPGPEPEPAEAVEVPRRAFVELRFLLRLLVPLVVIGLVVAGVLFRRVENAVDRLDTEAEQRCRGIVEGWRLFGDEVGATDERVDQFIRRLDREGLLEGCPPAVLER